MSLIKKLFSRSKDEEVDIEDFLNNLDVTEEDLYANADVLVKPITLYGDGEAAESISEIKKGNIVLLNIEDLSKRNPVRLKTLLNKIRETAEEVDGDIARVSHERVLITPGRTKIVKKK